jgi:hypothetical protein
MTQTTTARTPSGTDMWRRLIERPRDAVIEQLVANHPGLTREEAKADLEMAGF